MTSLATGQGASAFNQELSFETSSVTSMAYMFTVRALASNLQPSPPFHAACTTTAPTTLSPPGPHLALLATRQYAKKFNQPLDFDLSGIQNMKDMFKVRALSPTSRRALPCLRSPLLPCPDAPNLQPRGPFPAC